MDAVSAKFCKFESFFPEMLNMQFGYKWQSGFWEDVVWMNVNISAF